MRDWLDQTGDQARNTYRRIQHSRGNGTRRFTASDSASVITPKHARTGLPFGPRSSTLSSPKAGQPGTALEFRHAFRRVEHRVEDPDPASDWCVAARRDDQQIACRRGRDPIRFRAVPLHLQVVRFPKLDWHRGGIDCSRECPVADPRITYRGEDAV